MMCCSVNVNSQVTAVVLMVPLALVGSSGVNASLPATLAMRNRKYCRLRPIQSRRLVEVLIEPLNQKPLTLVKVAAAKKLPAASICASGTRELLRSR